MLPLILFRLAQYDAVFIACLLKGAVIAPFKAAESGGRGWHARFLRGHFGNINARVRAAEPLPFGQRSKLARPNLAD